MWQFPENGDVHRMVREFFVVDGRLISGQNPPSAEGVGEQLIKLLAADL